ncbi:hypothetical protein JOE52_006732 [Bradyrhizobium canariense]|nr:hypothetical protein [Bradyrhizobium canariense]
MTPIAFPRMLSKLVATLRVVGREPGVGDRGGQDKSRKVRPVGCGRNCIDFNDPENIANGRRNLGFVVTLRCCSVFDRLQPAR